MGIWYCTRERVKRALDSAETARNNTQVDAAIASATDQVEGLTHRRFYPTPATRYFRWPPSGPHCSYRLWLNADELISVTTLTAGGVVIPAADYFLEPINSGPPYTSVEIDLSSASAFSAGNTSQRAIAIEGVWGHSAVTAPAGALAAAVTTTSATTISVTDSAIIGVGDIILIGSERMIVTGKTMADTTVNIDAGDSLTASSADVGLTASSLIGIPVIDETILVGSERMLVVDAAGTLLTVRRAWDGSVLAAHAPSADLWAPRTLTVERGALGTTAATHLIAAAITKHVPPPLVSSLAVAEAMNTLLNEGSGYARVAGSGDNAREYWGRALVGLREQVYTRYGRQARMRAV